MRSSEQSKVKKIMELEETWAEHERNIIGLASAKEDLISCSEQMEEIRVHNVFIGHWIQLMNLIDWSEML